MKDGPLTTVNKPDRLPKPFGATISDIGGPGRERLGLVFPLLLVWLFYEFGRPAHPLGVPLLISFVAFASWVAARDKQWQSYSPWWFALLAVMVVGIPLARNTYAAFWSTKGMAVLFLTICLPLQAQVSSAIRVRIWFYALLLVTLYVGSWAATHGGFGPSGSGGGQDENYIAAMMGMSIGLAYFCFMAERRWWVKAVIVAAMMIYLAAIANGQNPSRGGFLGLCAVSLYCAARSPRKRVAFGILGALGLALAVIAGPAFWKEIRSTTDYESGTGDIRLEIWKAGLRMWAGNPLLGVGAGNFRWAIGDYQSAEQFTKFGRSLGGSIIAHSLPVELVAELGTLGAIATLGLTVGTWRALGRVRRRAREAERRGQTDEARGSLGIYADAIRAGILAILVNGVFLSLLYFSYLWLLIAVGSALAAISARTDGDGGALQWADGSPESEAGWRPPVRTPGRPMRIAAHRSGLR